MLIALCSDKGSPGTTTTALALASAWSSPAIVVEADPAGGDLGIRVRPRNTALPETPTVLTAATAARTALSSGEPAHLHAHRLNAQVGIIPSPLLSEQMGGIADWRPLAQHLAHDARPVLVDVGYLRAGSPALVIAAMADVVIPVARPDLVSVVRLRERMVRLVRDLTEHRSTAPRLFPVVVAPARHGANDVADVCAILSATAVTPFVIGSGFVALDPPAVRHMLRGENPAGQLRRTSLVRTSKVVAAELESLVRGQHAARTASRAGASS